jgi:hypothetical protein
MLRTGLLMFLLASVVTVSGQSILVYKFTGAEQGKALPAVLAEIETNTGGNFFYRPEWVQSLTIPHDITGLTLAEVLDRLFDGTDLGYIAMYPRTVIIVKDPTQAILHREAIETAVRDKKKIDRLVFGDAGKSAAGKVKITGKVIDAKSRLPVPRLNIHVSDQHSGVTTDEAGNYSLTLSPGLHVLTFSFLDYDTRVIDLEVYEDAQIDLEMEEAAVMLDEVVVQDQASRELTTSRVGLTQLNMTDMKQAPALLGEIDLVKQVQVLPGVTTVGEAAAGFNVRGGSVDQNLILYDGLPVFNSSHVFGFLSAFNSEAIRDVSFFRGGIPAEFGGRASSVLNISSKDGDLSKWNGNGGIGLITSNLMVNGPLKKDKTSLAASLRSTYSNWLVRSLRTDYADLSNSSVFFYDGTLKLTHLVSDRTRVSFTGYSSRDAFRLIGDSTYYWNNLQLSAKADHEFSESLRGEFVFGRSSYNYSVVNGDYRTASELSYRISTWVAKAGFHHQHGQHKVMFGWQTLHYRFNPGSLKPDSPESNAADFSLDKQYSVENAIYVSDEWQLNEKVLVEGGLRIPVFTSVGSASIYQYGEGPRNVDNIVDTLIIGKGKNIKTYWGLEPRLSVRWMTGAHSSIKLGYHRMYQYLHLVSNTTAVTPVDIWQPSGYYFKPQRSDQVSLGYFRDFAEKKYGASIEVFYKMLDNVIDFKDGAQLILNDHLETDLLQGKGTAHGVELSLTKNAGRLTGSVNYTYARAFRKIAGPTTAESISEGKKYPANFDQPHIANASWKYRLSRRYFFTGNFTFHSGRPVTIPLAAFVYEHGSVTYFSERNQYRIPDYHRLDLGLIMEGNHRRKKAGKATWSLFVYNVYARRNAYTVFFRNDESGIPKPYQLSIVGTIMPSLSYNFRF